MCRYSVARLGARKFTALQSPSSICVAAMCWTVKPLPSLCAIRAATCPAACAAPGLTARLMNRVGGFSSSESQRRQTTSTSPMLVFSDMLMRSGSCELTIASTWKFSARYLRVPDAAGFVAIAVGSTTASVALVALLRFSASTRNELAPPDKRAASGSSSVSTIAFSRCLRASSSLREN